MGFLPITGVIGFKDGPPVPVKSPLPVSVFISGLSGGSILSGGIVESTLSIGGSSPPSDAPSILFELFVLFAELISDGGFVESVPPPPVKSLNNPGIPSCKASVTETIN